MKHKRDFKALEKRRLRGGKLLARGMSKSEVARQLGVTRQTVAAWEQRLARRRPRCDSSAATLGRPRQLDAEQERVVGQGALMAGALSRRVFDGAMDVAPHRQIDLTNASASNTAPAICGTCCASGFYSRRSRSAERCSATSRRSCSWKRRQSWPALEKKATREGRTIVFIDESGLSEKCPGVTRTGLCEDKRRSFNKALPGSRCRPSRA